MPTVDISVPMISKKSGGAAAAANLLKTNPVVNMSIQIANFVFKITENLVNLSDLIR
jgi:hypothetical protein